MLLGIRWDASSWARAPLLVDRVLRSFHDVPLHWALPALPGDDALESEVVPVLRQRLATAGDVLLSVGFAGACHPLLELEELEHEVAWGLRNPWSTGLTQALGRKPIGLLPVWADLDRVDAARIYRKHGLGLVGVPAEGPFAISPTNGLQVFPCIGYPLGRPAARDDGAERRRLRRLLWRRRALFILVDLDRLPPAPEASQRVIGELARLLRASRRPFRTLADSGRPAGRGESRAGPLVDVPPTWELQRRLDAVAGIRSTKRRSAQATRTLLTVLAPSSPLPQPADRGAPALQERGLIAHMQGETILAGNRFDLNLVGGRFCGLRDRQGTLTPARPVASWVRVGARVLRFRSQTAFSFEDSEGIGLREELVADPCATLAVDYSFRGDDSRLWIEGTLGFPGLGPTAIVEESILFALSVAEVGPGVAAAVEVEQPGGARHEHPLADQSPWYAMAGSKFRVRTPRAVVVLAGLGSGDQRRPGWTVMLFRLAGGPAGRRYLEACPAGAAAAVAAHRLAGAPQRFALTVDVERC